MNGGILQIVYMDGLIEQLTVPPGVQVVKTPDVVVVGAMEIERRHVRRWTFHQTPGLQLVHGHHHGDHDHNHDHHADEQVAGDPDEGGA